MYFGQFSKKLSEQRASSGIKSQLRTYGHLLEESDDGIISINGLETSAKSLEEAKQYIIQQEQERKLKEDIKINLYENISDTKIASIIQEHHDIKVTDTLIETYIKFASSKFFTLDPVVLEIRKLNKLDILVEGKIDYILDDNSVIAINSKTHKKLNELFSDHPNIIEYMRESSNNFLKVIKDIGE